MAEWWQRIFFFHFLHFLYPCLPTKEMGFMWPNLLDPPRGLLWSFPWVIPQFKLSHSISFATDLSISWPEPNLPLCHLYYFQKNKQFSVSLNPTDFVLHAISSLWNTIFPTLSVQILPFFQSSVKQNILFKKPLPVCPNLNYFLSLNKLHILSSPLITGFIPYFIGMCIYMWSYLPMWR